MRIVLSGAERGASRSVLLSNGVQRVGVNLSQFHVPTRKELDLKEKFPEVDIYLYTSDDDTDVDGFDDFVRAHHEDLFMVIGRPDYDGSWLGSKYVPLWNDPHDLERLAHLCERYGRVAISDHALNKGTINRIRQLQHRWKCTLVGITSKADFIEALDWDHVLVGSWTSVMKFGETQVWDGHGLRRYPAAQKESARRKHRADIVRLGVDYDDVMADDVSAVTSLAIRSWLTWEMHDFQNAAYDPSSVSDDEEEFSSEEGPIATIDPDSHDGEVGDLPPSTLAIQPPKKRHGSSKKLLPILSIEEVTSSPTTLGEGPDEATEVDPIPVNVLKRTGDSLRACDSCYLSSRCPEFDPGSECAYNLPIELKTKDQLFRMLNVIIEMQVDRTMFAAFAEQLEGQGADVTVSREFDRVFNLVERFKEISDTRDSLSFRIEAKSNAGVLDRIFGSKVAERANELPAPLDTNDLVHQLGLIEDAEVIEYE